MASFFCHHPCQSVTSSLTGEGERNGIWGPNVDRLLNRWRREEGRERSGGLAGSEDVAEGGGLGDRGVSRSNRVPGNIKPTHKVHKATAGEKIGIPSPRGSGWGARGGLAGQ